MMADIGQPNEKRWAIVPASTEHVFLKGSNGKLIQRSIHGLKFSGGLDNNYNPVNIIKLRDDEEMPNDMLSLSKYKKMEE
jgi:hypothetical protein